MIQIKGLKHWNNQHKPPVFHSIGFEIAPGITGLLGANGAGKSTLLRVLATAVPIKEGEYYYNGVDVKQRPDYVRRVLGYLPQNFTFYQKMTINQILKYISTLKLLSHDESKSQVNYLLEVFNLLEFKHTPFEYLSGGMKQRVGLAQTFLNQPDIILLDEPTQGLDLIEKRSLFALLGDLGKKSIIVFSSHYVSELESLCRDVIILSKGTVKYQGPIDQLVRSTTSISSETLSTLEKAFFQFSNSNEAL